MPSSQLIAAGLQTGPVVLGYFFGALIGYPGPTPSMYTAWALLAVSFMLIGAVTALLRQRIQHIAEAKHFAVVCVISPMYAGGVVSCEPFLRITSIDEIVVAALALTPLLLSIGYLVRGQAWVSVVGTAFFVFISSAMIGSNTNNGVNGSGFFATWVA